MTAGASKSLWRLGWKRLLRRPTAVLSLTVLGGLIVTALLTPLLPLESPDRQNTRRAYAPPQLSGDAGFWIEDWRPSPRQMEGLLPWDRSLVRFRGAVFGSRAFPPWLGRDSLGRCSLSRLLWGARVSLLVAVVAGVISLGVGTVYGAFAGVMGGRIDNVMMRLVDAFYAIPFIFIVIFLITMLRASGEKSGAPPSSNLAVFLVVMGLVYWLTMARVVRGQVISIREQEFVEAAYALGSTPLGVLWRHVLPNTMAVVIVTLTLTIPRVMLFEAFLSFLGLGVEAPDVSWGLLVREAFDVLNPIQSPWWLVVWPSVFLAATLGALNHLGDALRDAFDPRLTL